MKFFIHLIATLVICYVLQSFLPWWTMAVGAFTVAYLFGNKGFSSFAAGFLGVGLLWIGFAFYVDVLTDSILTEKINWLLPVNSFILTLLIGGLVGGFASLTGSLMRSK
ncbi:MAG: hypothetical protein SH808_02490 [Saprospiraceae bacterium]|nr:hypothetical protein [Saprospiraceae bacterium]